MAPCSTVSNFIITYEMHIFFNKIQKNLIFLNKILYTPLCSSRACKEAGRPKQSVNKLALISSGSWPALALFLDALLDLTSSSAKEHKWFFGVFL